MYAFSCAVRLLATPSEVRCTLLTGVVLIAQHKLLQMGQICTLGLITHSRLHIACLATQLLKSGLCAGASKAVLLEPHMSQGRVGRSFVTDSFWHIAVGFLALVGVLSTMFLSEHDLQIAAMQLMASSRQHSDWLDLYFIKIIHEHTIFYIMLNSICDSLQSSSFQSDNFELLAVTLNQTVCLQSAHTHASLAAHCLQLGFSG